MKRASFVCCLIAMMFAVPLFARPHHGPGPGPYWGPYRGPYRGPYGRPYGGPPPYGYPNSGLYTAAGIVSLVGASLGTLRAIVEPRVVVAAPAQPVVVAPPVQPVVVAPPAQPVVYSQPVNYAPVQQPQPQPQPRKITINPDGTKVIEY